MQYMRTYITEKSTGNGLDYIYVIGTLAHEVAPARVAQGAVLYVA